MKPGASLMSFRQLILLIDLGVQNGRKTRYVLDVPLPKTDLNTVSKSKQLLKSTNKYTFRENSPLSRNSFSFPTFFSLSLFFPVFPQQLEHVQQQPIWTDRQTDRQEESISYIRTCTTPARQQDKKQLAVNLVSFWQQKTVQLRSAQLSSTLGRRRRRRRS